MKILHYASACGIMAFAVAASLLCCCSQTKMCEQPTDAQLLELLSDNGCFQCHSSSQKLPSYANLPVIGKSMKQHIRHGKDFLDFDAAFAQLPSIDDATLAKLEHSVEYGTMPLAEYRLVHWGSGIDANEAATLRNWISDKRGGVPDITPVPASIPFDAAKAVLGEKMYNDGRISIDGTISCATCHILDQGGADEHNERVSEGVDGNLGTVNAPTVYNSFFNVRQFWNGRAADLKEQAAGPPVNPLEMGDQTFDQIVERLRQDKALVKEFEALYPGEGITQSSVTDAIAEFEKTLLTPDSRFDLYLKGDASAMSAEELAGYQAFKANSCAACHTGVILGGKSFEKLSIYGDYFADRSSDIAYNGDDDGLKGFTGNDSDYRKYKVPGLRNVAITAPYFHDGTMLTMEDAVKAMAKYELGKELSDADVSSIVAFMRTLTGKHPYLKVE